MGKIIKDCSPFRKDFAHALMGFLDKARDLFINLAGFGFTVVFPGRKTFREKHRLARTLVAHQAQAIAHAVFRDHGPGNVRGALQIVLGAGGDFIENQFLCYPAA
jgi:hypothetical protein